LRDALFGDLWVQAAFRWIREGELLQNRLKIFGWVNDYSGTLGWYFYARWPMFAVFVFPKKSGGVFSGLYGSCYRYVAVFAARGDTRGADCCGAVHL
jgi:hypothetical protein